MKKEYDFIFSLGSACLCSQMLRKKGLQTYSYPLDWVRGGDFSQRVDFLLSEFKDYFNKEDFVFEEIQNTNKDNPCDVYINLRTGMSFPHDFLQGNSFDEEFEKNKDKYNRRINRLLMNINKNKDILIVYTVVPTENQEDTNAEILKSCYERICNKFKEQKIDILYILCADKYKEVDITPNIKKIYFDFSAPNEEPNYNVKKLRTIVNSYKLRKTLYEDFKIFIFKMKKRIKRWKCSIF